MKTIKDGLKANDSMNLAVEAVRKSGEEMEQALKKLMGASQSISKISQELHEIGSSTQILAVNAAIAASQAGSFGTNFAVVAKEIKEIAKVCREASDRTATLLEQSMAVSDSALEASHHIQHDIREIILHQQDITEVLMSAAETAPSRDVSPVANGTPPEDSTLVFHPDVHGTGVPIVDSQHQKLFEMVNELEEACRQGKAREEMATILNFMGEYVQEHFKVEEAIMERHKCSALAKNKKEHAKLIETYVHWRTAYENEGAKLSMVMELRAILSQWLVNHICGVDRCLLVKREIPSLN